MVNAFTKQEIMSYGKSKGYSEKAINKVINDTKYDIANYAINSGYKGSTINKVLNDYGYDNYNPVKAKANWENLLPNISKNAKEFYRDMKTIGGVALQPFMDVRDAEPGTKRKVAAKKFLETIQNDRIKRMGAGIVGGAALGSTLPFNKVLGTAGGAITGGLVGLLGGKELVDAFLDTYDTKLSDFGKKNAREILANASQGAFNNPLYAGLDALSTPFVGAKAVGKAGKSIGKVVPKSSPMWVQSIIQSPEVRTFNRDVTEAIEGSKTRNIDLIKPLHELNSSLDIDNEALARYIMLGDKGKLEGRNLQLADNLLKSIRKGENKAFDYGLLEKDFSKRNVVSQYAMQHLMDKIPNILHRDLMQYIETKQLTPRMAQATLANPNLKSYIDEVISTADKLYDEGKIGFISQALIGTVDPLGEIKASDIAKTRGGGYFGTSREIGRATLKDIAKKIEDSVEYQQTEIAKATSAIDALNMLMDRPGFTEVVKDVDNIPKGKTVVNMKVFKAKIKDAIQGGKDVNVVSALNASRVPEEGALLIDNIYFDAIKNAMTPSVKSSPRDAANAFKKTVLASPHWAVQNRIGNWSNNAMGGVTIFDGVDAIANKNIMPERLMSQTSFSGYTGGSGLSLPEAIVAPIKKTKKEWAKFNDSNKGLTDLGRVLTQTLSESSNLFTNPIFNIESRLEAYDRYANMIHQAKELAKDKSWKGKNWKDIIKKANKDQKLFNKLNREVNKDLGDYIGRNYLIPNSVYEKLGLLVPFYRFLTQTGRTTLHQLANHGVPFQATVMNPARAGRSFSEDVMRIYGLNQNEYEGGMPYNINEDGSYRYVGSEPLPFGAVAQDLLSDSNKGSLLSPMYTMGNNILNYKTSFGTLPSSPGLTAYKLANGTSKGYEPTLGERIGYAVNQLSNTFYAPTRDTHGWMRDLFNTVFWQPGLSTYDSVPIIPKSNPLSYDKELWQENIGKWLGIQTRPYYKKTEKKNKKPSKYDVQNKARYQRQYRRNTKEGK